MATQPDATRTQSVPSRELPFIVAALGALVGAAFLFAVTSDVIAGLLLGGPIGLLVSLIGFRTIPRIISAPDAEALANGAAPQPPTIEEMAKPAFRMKTRG
ncbi:MAG: hypothetical protein ABI559_08365 [Chloroflexota bacterium]